MAGGRQRGFPVPCQVPGRLPLDRRHKPPRKTVSADETDSLQLYQAVTPCSNGKDALARTAHPGGGLRSPAVEASEGRGRQPKRRPSLSNHSRGRDALRL